MQPVTMKPGKFAFTCRRCGQLLYWVGGPLGIELVCGICGNTFVLVEKKKAGTQESLSYGRKQREVHHR